MYVESHTPLLIQAEAAYVACSSEPARGITLARSVAKAARAAGEDEALVVALRAIGSASRDLYRHEQAAEVLSEAVQVASARGLDDRLCQVLITRSSARMELGQMTGARRDLERARNVASTRTRAEVEFAYGLLADKTGRFGLAAASYRRALVDMPVDRTVLRVKALNNLALTLSRRGRHDDAEQFLLEALALTARHQLTARQGIVMESYAEVAVDAGRPVEALRRYEQAEQLLTAVGVQLVDLYVGKARALLSILLLDEAADAATRAVAAADGSRTGGPLMLAEALLPHARIALLQDRLEDAASAAARAEELFRQQRRGGWRAAAALLHEAAVWRLGKDAAVVERLDRVCAMMRRIGDVAGVVESAVLQGDVSAALGRRRKARHAYTVAAARAAKGSVVLRLQGRTAAARVAELDGDSRRIGQVCGLGLDELAAFRATLASAELRARAAGYGIQLGEIGLRSALRSGRSEQIWTWIERSSSVVLVRGATPTGERLRTSLGELRAVESEYDATAPDAPERAVLLRRLSRLERRIRTLSWTDAVEGARVTSPSVRRLRALRRDLGARALIQYGLVDGTLHGVAVTPGAARHAAIGRLDELAAVGRRLAFALRRMTSLQASTASRTLAHDSARHELAELDRTLLAPFEPQLGGAEEVVVVPPAALTGIPWASLTRIADRPVRVTPSALSWWSTRGRSVPSGRTLAVAGPRLPHAEEEVRRVIELHAGDRLALTGHAATTEAVRRDAAGAALVHVAAHGRLRSDSPTFSSLQLADGPLTVHDLESLSAPAGRWVLAACDLGRPGAVAGPALEGVVASLLGCGSAAVVAATVSVPDLDTRQLMVQLHRFLAAGWDMAESLRRAKSAVDQGDPMAFVASLAFTCFGGG